MISRFLSAILFLASLSPYCAFAQCPGSPPSGIDCVAASGQKNITAFSQCRSVTNNHASAKALMVPIKTSTEWSSFYGNPPSGVTVTTCSSPSNLLLKGENSNGSQVISDSSGNGVSLTVAGNTQNSTAQKQYGSGSVWFDGTGDYLTAIGNENLQPGSGNFTIEFWVRPSSLGGFQCLVDLRSSTYTAGIALAINGSNQIYTEINSSYLITDSTALANNTWYHIALVRSGTTLTVYKNGVSIGSTTTSANFTGGDFTIGTYHDVRDAAATYHFNGYIDNFRFTKGTAVYTSGFTPPGDF